MSQGENCQIVPSSSPPPQIPSHQLEELLELETQHLCTLAKSMDITILNTLLHMLMTQRHKNKVTILTLRQSLTDITSELSTKTETLSQLQEHCRMVQEESQNLRVMINLLQAQNESKLRQINQSSISILQKFQKKQRENTEQIEQLVKEVRERRIQSKRFLAMVKRLEEENQGMKGIKSVNLHLRECLDVERGKNLELREKEKELKIQIQNLKEQLLQQRNCNEHLEHMLQSQMLRSKELIEGQPTPTHSSHFGVSGGRGEVKNCLKDIEDNFNVQFFESENKWSYKNRDNSLVVEQQGSAISMTASEQQWNRFKKARNHQQSNVSESPELQQTQQQHQTDQQQNRQNIQNDEQLLLSSQSHSQNNQRQEFKDIQRSLDSVSENFNKMSFAQRNRFIESSSKGTFGEGIFQVSGENYDDRVFGAIEICNKGVIKEFKSTYEDLKEEEMRKINLIVIPEKASPPERSSNKSSFDKQKFNQILKKFSEVSQKSISPQISQKQSSSKDSQPHKTPSVLAPNSKKAKTQRQLSQISNNMNQPLRNLTQIRPHSSSPLHHKQIHFLKQRLLQQSQQISHLQRELKENQEFWKRRVQGIQKIVEEQGRVIQRVCGEKEEMGVKAVERERGMVEDLEFMQQHCKKIQEKLLHVQEKLANIQLQKLQIQKALEQKDNLYLSEVQKNKRLEYSLSEQKQDAIIQKYASIALKLKAKDFVDSTLREFKKVQQSQGIQLLFSPTRNMVVSSLHSQHYPNMESRESSACGNVMFLDCCVQTMENKSRLKIVKGTVFLTVFDCQFEDISTSEIEFRLHTSQMRSSDSLNFSKSPKMIPGKKIKKFDPISEQQQNRENIQLYINLPAQNPNQMIQLPQNPSPHPRHPFQNLSISSSSITQSSPPSPPSSQNTTETQFFSLPSSPPHLSQHSPQEQSISLNLGTDNSVIGGECDWMNMNNQQILVQLDKIVRQTRQQFPLPPPTPKLSPLCLHPPFPPQKLIQKLKIKEIREYFVVRAVVKGQGQGQGKGGGGGRDYFVLWKEGIVSLRMRQGAVMAGTKKHIYDGVSWSMGNSQLVVQKNMLWINRKKQGNYLYGMLGDHKWKMLEVIGSQKY